MNFSVFIGFMCVSFVVFYYLKIKTTRADNKEFATNALLVIVALALATVILNVFTIIGRGNVGVGSFFSSVQKSSYAQGFNLVNPFHDIHEMDIKRKVVELNAKISPEAEKDKEGKDKEAQIEGSGEIIALSHDNLVLAIEATCPFALNPAYAWWVYRNIGDEEIYINQLIIPAARSALRDAVAQTPFIDASTERRNQLAQLMTETFAQAVANDLSKQGLSLEEASKVFVILPVQLRKVLPPDKVQSAISEKIASEQDLQRQHTLTSIAEEIANRRKKEGAGIKNLFNELPQNISPKDMSQLLHAMAEKERADAVMKAVETGQAKNLFIGTGISPAVPMQ